MYRIALIAAAGALAPLAATAQTAPAPATTAPATTAAPAAGAALAVGATVYDGQGGVVGTVASTDGTTAVVDTGTNKASIAVSSFGTGPKGPVLGMTKAQIDAAAATQSQQAMADFKTKLVAGTAVYGTAGAQLGTIKSADAQFITLTTGKGEAKLPVASFAPGPQGVTIGMTQAQLDAAIAAAAPKK